MLSFMENDDRGTERRYIDVVRLETLNCRLQLRSKMTPECHRRISKELEKIVMQPIGSRAIYDDVRYSQDLNTHQLYHTRKM